MKILTRNPSLLYSYLVTEMLAPFFAAFLIMNGVFFLVRLLPFLNFALDLNIDAANFIRLLAYMFPNIFLYTLPMASMMGIIIGYSRLSNDAEILALKASGISMYQILPPIITTAAVIALATAYFSVRLIPISESNMQQLTYQLLKEKVDKGIREDKFTEALGDLVVHVGSIDKKTGKWAKVWVSDMRDRTTPTITMASTGEMHSNLEHMKVTIILHNGSLHRPDGKDSQIVKFGKYIINIPLQPPGGGLSQVDRGTLTMSQLQAAADAAGRNTKRGRILRIEYHKRLVLPVGCLILTLLGLPLGLQAGPGKKATGIPLGLGFFIFYYILFAMSKMYAEDGAGPVGVLMWLPNCFFLIVALYSIWRSTNEKSLLPEPAQFFFRRLNAWTLRPLTQTTMRWLQLFSSLRPGPTDRDSGRSWAYPANRQKAIRGDVHSRVFHLPECEHYNCPHCSLEFKDVQIAEEAGFLPCDFCRSVLEAKRNVAHRIRQASEI